eukprot:4373025-Pleurochrysis_carterae.AAC.3
MLTAYHEGDVKQPCFCCLLTGSPNPAVQNFATCAFVGTKCSGIGPPRCPVTARRELEKEKPANKREIQGNDPCSIFKVEGLCNSGYTYNSGRAYNYDSYSLSNPPPDLAICEWSAGSCSTRRTCPYMSELASQR